MWMNELKTFLDAQNKKTVIFKASNIFYTDKCKPVTKELISKRKSLTRHMSIKLKHHGVIKVSGYIVDVYSTTSPMKYIARKV